MLKESIEYLLKDASAVDKRQQKKDRTLEKQAGYNLNILRKFALNILKLLPVDRTRASLRLIQMKTKIATI